MFYSNNPQNHIFISVRKYCVLVQDKNVKAKFSAIAEYFVGFCGFTFFVYDFVSGVRVAPSFAKVIK